ncbi:hypothetical protein FACS189494_09240 [Spirochaetia bacterium]|nr:hypothetical protein FACS189494_09240 [Spirochaetia bacterium]
MNSFKIRWSMLAFLLLIALMPLSAQSGTGGRYALVIGEGGLSIHEARPHQSLKRCG